MLGAMVVFTRRVLLESRSKEASVRDGPLQKTEISRITGILDNGAEQFRERPEAN